jgi:cytochrome c-type biogenesis protein CcmH
MKRFFIAIAFIATIATNVNAQTLSNDPAVEARLKALSQELRCLVCQNQTLADSSAPLAEDLRREIRELIAKGMTDEEITAYLVARYGDFVRVSSTPQISNSDSLGGADDLIACWFWNIAHQPTSS